MIQPLSLYDILDLRDQIIAHSDLDDAEFRFEMVNAHGLISALATPFQGAFGTDSFPSLAEKAAALTFLLIANHPFRDGNKRVAGAALLLFLQRNGRDLAASPDEVKQFTALAAEAHLRDSHLTEWLTPRI